MRAGERAYRTLRSEILDGALEPGTVLQEVEQSIRLGVSRTPVREALRRLAADGLVEAGGRGTVVTGIDRDDIVSLYELREAVEGKAAALAARRRDEGRFDPRLVVDNSEVGMAIVVAVGLMAIACRFFVPLPW